MEVLKEVYLEKDFIFLQIKIIIKYLEIKNMLFFLI